MDARAHLKALNREFAAPGSTMAVSVFKSRLALLQHEAQVEREMEAKAAPAAPAPDDPPVTRGFLEEVLRLISGNIGKAVNARIAKAMVERDARLDELSTRLDARSKRTRTTYTRDDHDELVSSTTRPLDDDLDAALQTIREMVARVKALEARPRMQYMGIWAAAADYREGDFVTDRGSLFHCNVTGTKSRPGTDETYQLAAKRGADGKDSR